MFCRKLENGINMDLSQNVYWEGYNCIEIKNNLYAMKNVTFIVLNKSLFLPFFYKYNIQHEYCKFPTDEYNI